MTKSIEEQAKEYAAMAYASPKEKVIAMIAYDHGANWAAKDRDARWSAVVSELREALNNIIGERVWFCESCIKHQNISRESLTKADQILKDMEKE